MVGVMMSERDPDVSMGGEADVSAVAMEIEREMERRSRMRLDRVLRWAGVVCLGCLLVETVMGVGGRWYPEKVMAVVLLVGLLAGFLTGGRWLLLGIAVLMGVLMMLMYPLENVVRMSRRLSGGTLFFQYWYYLVGVTPFVITVVCGVALFVRGRKRG